MVDLRDETDERLDAILQESVDRTVAAMREVFAKAGAELIVRVARTHDPSLAAANAEIERLRVPAKSIDSILDRLSAEYAVKAMGASVQTVERLADELRHTMLEAACALAKPYLDRAKAAEAAPPASAPAEGVAVKALEWVTVKGSQQAETPFYGIEISPVEDDTGEHWATYIRQRGSVYRRSGTEAVAKSAAQADYEARIRSALASPPPARSYEEGIARAALTWHTAGQNLHSAVVEGRDTADLREALYQAEGRLNLACRSLQPKDA